MQFGRHIIDRTVKSFDLNAAEAADMINTGPQYWFEFQKIGPGRPKREISSGGNNVKSLHDRIRSPAAL